LFGNRPVLEGTLNGDESQDEFWVMIIMGSLLIDDLCKFLLRHIGQPCWVPLQYFKNLLDTLLPIMKSGNEIWEVEGEGEDDEKEGDFKENTGNERPNFFVNIRMGGMPRTYQRIKIIHINLLVKIVNNIL
jgi:hypothetical protein